MPLTYHILQVNHFPGSGYITNKVNLATSGLPHVPVAFKIPEKKAELIAYVRNLLTILQY